MSLFSCFSSHSGKLRSLCDRHMTNSVLRKLADDWFPSGLPQTASGYACVCVPVGFSDIYSRVRSLFNHCPWVSLGCFACSNFRQLMPYLVFTNRSPIHGTLSWDRGFRAGLAVLTGVKPMNKRSRTVCMCACRCVRTCIFHLKKEMSLFGSKTLISRLSTEDIFSLSFAYKIPRLIEK